MGRTLPRERRAVGGIIGGRRMEYAEIQLPDLLSIVDKAEELAN